MTQCVMLNFESENVVILKECCSQCVERRFACDRLSCECVLGGGGGGGASRVCCKWVCCKWVCCK